MAFVLLMCIAAAGVAEAGQFRIAPPSNMRKRQPPRNYRESYLEIVNDDDRGYAIDVDYRRNRLTLAYRDRGDIYVPGRSRITLVFDDDDNWRIDGDYQSLEIEIRSGRTSRLRLETRADRNRIGLFATVEGGRRQSVQLFHYADRPGHSNRPGGNRPPPPAPIARPPVHTPQRPPSRPHTPPQPSRPTPPPPSHGRNEPSTGAKVGAVVGGIIGSLIDDDKPDHRPGGPRR